MESPKHADHPLVRSGAMAWMPMYRCHANPDRNVPNGYGRPASDVRGFCQAASRYWKQHPDAPKWIKMDGLLSPCFDPAYGSIDPQSQWHPDVGSVYKGIARGWYDVEQVMYRLAPVLGMLRNVFHVDTDELGIWLDTEPGPMDDVFEIWHRATGWDRNNFEYARKVAEYDTVTKVLDALDCNAKLVDAEANKINGEEHYWTADEIPDGISGAYCHIDPIPWTNENRVLSRSEVQRQLALATQKQCAAVFIFADGIDGNQLTSLFSPAVGA